MNYPEAVRVEFMLGSNWNLVEGAMRRIKSLRGTRRALFYPRISGASAAPRCVRILWRLNCGLDKKRRGRPPPPSNDIRRSLRNTCPQVYPMTAPVRTWAVPSIFEEHPPAEVFLSVREEIKDWAALGGRRQLSSSSAGLPPFPL